MKLSIFGFSRKGSSIFRLVTKFQAQKFFTQLIGCGEYGSRGYVDKFIKRHDIRLLKISGEKLSNNVAIIDDYVKQFTERMQSENLQPLQIFNANESGLYFKGIPSSTYVSKDADCASGRKFNKGRVTFMKCSNMDGSFKLPLMLIGKHQNPRALKNLKEFPVYYMASKNAWMTGDLFKNWFIGQFVPQVTDFLLEEGLPVKAVFILDNCSAHFNSEELKTENGSIFSIFLPPNTTAIIQPMDQHIIQMIKTRYRKIMMREVLGRNGEFHKDVKYITIKNTMFWIAETWESIPPISIRKSWNMLYDNLDKVDEDDIPLSVLKDRLRCITAKIYLHEGIDEENAEFEVLKDEEIIDKLLHPFQGEDMSYTQEDEINVSVSPESTDEMVSDDTALNGVDILIRYAEENGFPLNTQFTLRKVRQSILEKRFGENT